MMNIVKTTAIAAVTLMIGFAAEAEAGVITKRFTDSSNMLVAMNGPASETYTTNSRADQVVDGSVSLNFKNITYWADGFYNTATLAPTGFGQRGRTSRQEMTESINSWTFTVSHGGVSESFSPIATGRERFGKNSLSFATDAFDGVVAGGDWLP